jgi:acetoacetyl-CoA synthetase
MSNLEVMTHISNLQRYAPSSSSFQITSHCAYQTAWMMWPYMLGGLACGARMILYEGSPFYPDVKTYLKFIDQQKYRPVPT